MVSRSVTPVITRTVIMPDSTPCGYIDVQTEVERGTTFTLYFPVTREEVITQ
jgi:hypothetical protein